MLQLRKAADRGHAEHGWLESFHTFSFANFYDPAFMGFRSLRVINEDFIAGGKGFPTHPHQDMEIITYIVEGALEHRDSMGTSSVIRPGEVQHMSAGTGVQHSEFNHSREQNTHLLQIWILPDKRGMKPRYGQKSFLEAMKTQDLVLAASPEGRDGSIPIYQDADLYVARWDSGRESVLKLRAKDRYAWVQVVRGDLEVNGMAVQPGDGIAVAGEESIRLKANGAAEFLAFDLQ